VILHTVLVAIAAGPVLGVPWHRVLRATGPATAGALGVAAGAGLVRVLMPSLSVAPVLLGTVAGAIGGLLALRVLAAGTISDLVEQLRRLRGGAQASKPDERVPTPSA
jgi:hypothetical protein